MTADDTTQIRLENHLTNLSTVLYSLYETSTLVDVTLACDGGNLFAHKIILSASSPFFAEIFASNPCKHPVIVLRSQNFTDMKTILEFMYRGHAAIEPKILKSILKITKELEIKGFEKLAYMNSMNMIPNISGIRDKSDTKTSDSTSYSRDTRFKGTKRVMVNFEEGFISSSPKKANSTASSVSKDFSGSDVEPLLVVAKEVNYESDLNDNAKLDLISPASELMKKDLVDLDCKLCCKSFKNRNQLYKHMAVHRGKTFRRVHTGERPYECRRCGKAFARQDKLKLHIKSSHDSSLDSSGATVEEEDSRELSREAFGRRADISVRCRNGNGDFQIGQVQDELITLYDSFCASEDREHYTLRPKNEFPPPEIKLEAYELPEIDCTKKRGRGRPRKYPLKAEPIRKAAKLGFLKEESLDKSIETSMLNRVLNPPGPKRGRGRPRKSLSIEAPEKQDNYNLNNLPFGDLNLLTMPLMQEMIEMPNDISAVNTNLTTDDRSQDPLNINHTTNTNSTESENILGLNNINDININENGPNSHFNIRGRDNALKHRTLESLKLIANLNALTDITITAQPTSSTVNDKTDRCDNDISSMCQDSSSMDSSAVRSVNNDIYDIDVKHEPLSEPLSDTDGDLVIDENRVNDIDSSISKINIVDIHSNVLDDSREHAN